MVPLNRAAKIRWHDGTEGAGRPLWGGIAIPMKTSYRHLIHAGAFALATLFAYGAAGCAATNSRESTGEYVDDATITTKVKAKFVKDDVVKEHEITVETFRGVVQLSGFVDNTEQKDRAALIAQTVAGVREVKNNIQIKVPASQ